ncbi:MinD-like ATPase involved in chromosome partitioning or flagellar assembly [Nocardia sp. GAS34]|uniref:MinD/ParA family ATP-binding protein n=1 Tax=Nocardia sp. GAS34 TaxID=3156305 RepID=UPI003D1C47FA
MTNDNSTSPPWLQGHGGDTTTEHDDPTAAPHNDGRVDEPAPDAEPAESSYDGAGEEEQASGMFPPVPDSMEQTPFPGGPQFEHDHQPGPEQHLGAQSQFPPEGQFPEHQFGQEHQGAFPPPGGQPMGGFPPPSPFTPQGQFAPNPGFAPPGGFPMPEQGGPFAPPGGPADPTSFAPPNFGDLPPQPYGEMPGPEAGAQPNFSEPPVNYGEARQETPYGEVRQEIGSDGMVRRVFNEDPQAAPAPEPQQYGGEQFSWAPPPPPAPPAYQPPPQQQSQPGGWGGPPSQPNFPQQHPPQQPPQAQQPPQPQQQPPQPGFTPQHMQQQLGQPGHSVNDLNLLKRARRSPRSGWRRAVHKMSGGAINPGESSADVVVRELTERVNQPVRGDYRIAILSLKGGVGKTTTTVGLGSTFASVRGDRVIAIDANPDLGTLAHRVPRQTRSTVRNLLEDRNISRYSDVRAHTSQAPSRLEVLASEQDPAVSEAFSEEDYRRAISILQQFYNIILTDCGTGLMHSAMSGVLDMASSLILVTSPAIDGARSASATLDWLEHHGYNKLVERTVVVVNASRRGASTVDLDQLRKLFLDRTRAVQVVPFDDHLAEGAEIDLELVSKPTRTALLELAAMVADDFGFNVPQAPFPLPNQYPGQPGQFPGGQGQYPGQGPFPGPQGPYPGQPGPYPGDPFAGPDHYGQ